MPGPSKARAELPSVSRDQFGVFVQSNDAGCRRFSALTATSLRFGGRRSPPPTFVTHARMAFASRDPSRVHLGVFRRVDPSAARFPAREAVGSAFACKPQTDQAARQPLIGGIRRPGLTGCWVCFGLPAASTCAWANGSASFERTVRRAANSATWTHATSQHDGFWSRLRP